MPISKWKDKYEVSVENGRYANGRIKYKREIVNTKKSAIQREKALLEEVKKLNDNFANHAPVRNNEMFRDAALKWIKQKKGEIAQKTWCRYNGIITHHMIPAFNKSVSDIDEDEVRDYFVANTNSGTTLQQHYTILRNILTSNNNNVMQNIKRPRKENTEVNCIKDTSALAEFVASFKESVLFLPVYLASVTGMRLSEIAGLRWSDVDFNSMNLTVNRSLHWNDGEYYTKSTKNGSSKRTIRISEKDVEVLSEVKTNRNAKEGEFICLRENGTPICKDSVSSNFKARAKVRGWDVSFHSLRHSHATILIQHYKASINAVSKRLGHADEVTTLSIYASVLPREDGEIAVMMGEMMSEIKT